MLQDNDILVQTKAFAVRIVRLVQHLTDNKGEMVMSKQILISGTRIGANCHQSRFAQSEVDFINIMSIALKEASDTLYWLDMLHQAGCLTDSEYDSIYDEGSRISETLVNIVKTGKENAGIGDDQP